MKKYEKEQEDIKHLKEFIASCGTYANLVKQVSLHMLGQSIMLLLLSRPKKPRSPWPWHPRALSILEILDSMMPFSQHFPPAKKPQAKSKQKILDKMEADGLTKPVSRERTFAFRFPDCEKLPPPVLPFIDVRPSESDSGS